MHIRDVQLSWRKSEDNRPLEALLLDSKGNAWVGPLGQPLIGAGLPGGVEKIAWSADGAMLAYCIGTAVSIVRGDVGGNDCFSTDVRSKVRYRLIQGLISCRILLHSCH